MRLAQENIGGGGTLLVEALAAHQELGEHRLLKIGYLQTMLATVGSATKFADAEHMLRDTLDLFDKNIAPIINTSLPPSTTWAKRSRAEKFADAETVLSQQWIAGNAPARRLALARSASALGEVLHRQRRNEEAERYLVESYRELSADPAADRDSRRIAHERIARFYTELGQKQKLDALIAEHIATPG